MSDPRVFVAFVGSEIVARGTLFDVVKHSKIVFDSGIDERIAFYDDETGRVVDLDLVGSEDEVMAKLRASVPREEPKSEKQKGPGRPKLGVVSREVSLLPRHWSWLGEQRGGASAAIRRLVETARKQNSVAEQMRRTIEAAHRFLWDVAGDLPNFEEATRMLFAGDLDGLERQMGDWPEGIREQLGRFTDRVREIDTDER
ncbi:MAG: DUF2239 family protein [Alphaproteobacteria bacterium]